MKTLDLIRRVVVSERTLAVLVAGLWSISIASGCGSEPTDGSRGNLFVDSNSAKGFGDAGVSPATPEELAADDKAADAERDAMENGTDAADSQKADLPYDARLQPGDSYTLAQSFAEKGPQPVKVLGVIPVDVVHHDELLAGTPYTVTQADCDREGNRATGRDRVFVMWQNPDGSTETDHIDLRYCK